MNFIDSVCQMTKQFTTVLALTACLATVAQAQGVQGNAKAGQAINAMCIGCHGIKGYQSSFPEVHKVPMISGQSAVYIAASLNAYKKGERKHPTMRAVSESLTDQNIADLSAYYAAHGAVEGQSAPKAPPAASAEIVALLNKTNCASCHGANFNVAISPAYAKLAGQHADYLYVALKAYKTDNNPRIGRANPIMASIAKQYTNAELKLLANYLSKVDGDLKTVSEKRFR